jgi:hypothetical protein
MKNLSYTTGEFDQPVEIPTPTNEEIVDDILCGLSLSEANTKVILEPFIDRLWSIYETLRKRSLEIAEKLLPEFEKLVKI